MDLIGISHIVFFGRWLYYSALDLPPLLGPYMHPYKQACPESSRYEVSVCLRLDA